MHPSPYEASDDLITLSAPQAAARYWAVSVQAPFGTGARASEVLEQYQPVSSSTAQYSEGLDLEWIHKLTGRVWTGDISGLSGRVSPGSISSLSRSSRSDAISRLSARKSPGSISRLSGPVFPGAISKLSGS